MEILDKFINSDVWIHSGRQIGPSIQYSWSMPDFRQFLTCNYVDSFRFKFTESDSCQWWMTLYPMVEDPFSQDYISLKLRCSEPTRVCTMYQLSLVNSDSDVLNSFSGYFNGTEKHLEKFIERNLLNEITSPNNNLLINCRLTVHGDVASEIWERSIYDETASRDESVDLLSKDLRSLLDDNRFSDVTLKGHSSSEIFQAHRDILTSRSDFLKTLFWDQDSQPHRLPKLCPYATGDPSDESETIKQILVYLYSNKNGILSHPHWKNLCCASYGLNLKLLQINCLKALLKDCDLDRKYIMTFLESFCDDECHEIHTIIHRFLCHHETQEYWEGFLMQSIGDLACRPFDSYLRQNEITQSSSNEIFETVVSQRNILWSIYNFSTFVTNKSITLSSPTFRIIDSDYRMWYINFQIFEGKSLFLKVGSLDGKYNGHVQFQISVVDSMGQQHYASDIKQEDLTVGKSYIYSHFICLLENYKKIDVSCNDLLTVRCFLKVVINPKKTVSHNDSSTFVHDMRSLYESAGDSGDLTIRCDGQDLRVHKYMICARSNVFDAMFRQDMEESRNNVVDIADEDVTSLKAMLLYIYTGVVDDLNEESAASLLKLADRYDVHGLKDLCSKYLSSLVCIRNVFDFLEIADTHSDERLKSAACKFISFHADAIMDSDQGKELMQSQFHQLIAAKQ